MVNLHYISPFFIVSSLKTAVLYYKDKLGFDIVFISPAADPFFAIVGRGQISIMLKQIGAGIQATPNHTRHQWARWDAYISTSEPDILFEEYNTAGVAFHQTIQNDGDGLYGFEVADEDGYVLFFGRPAV